ncbi:hypothetical protein ABMC89_13170 [Sulfitobacter sp. HNIBRBA3233]|uniref:hypothetical protein n=1 Tax=Sulfitobacter marinivivus TaxID=3158558 RepID=UPI0032E02540
MTNPRGLMTALIAGLWLSGAAGARAETDVPILDGLGPVKVEADGSLSACDHGLCGNRDVFLRFAEPDAAAPVLLRSSSPMGDAADNPEVVAWGNASPGRFSDAAFGKMRDRIDGQVNDRRPGQEIMTTDTQGTSPGCGWNGTPYNPALALDQEPGPVFMDLLASGRGNTCEREQS